MPTYEYLCHACNHRLEIVQRMSDEPLSECPACHEAALVKQISAVGFQLKGTGWYVTDFRDKGNARKAGNAEGTGDAESKAATPADGGESKAGESKTGESKADGSKADGSKADGSKADGSEAAKKPKAATAGRD